MSYIITLIAFIVLYVGVIYLMKYMRNTKLTNTVFALVVFIAYVGLGLTIYLDVGFNDWNFQNTLPFANVSPFMFFSIPLALLLPKKINAYFLLLISLLSVGMFLSSVFECVYNAVINYKFHIHFTYNFFSHFALSLFGVYIIRSGQVTLNIKNALKSSIIIFTVATTMLIVNLIFNTAFFGLSLNGKHNIYNIVLVENSYLSALIYYTGLTLVVVLGYLYSKVFSRNNFKINVIQ